MSHPLKLATGLLSLVAAAPVMAGPMQFTVTGHDTASFTLDAASSAGVAEAGGYRYALFDNVAGLYDGVSGLATISFYDAPSGGGFQVTFGSSYFSPEGPVVFQGSLSNPVFAPGTFLFTQDFHYGAVNDQLVISNPAVVAVPELGTWSMMVLGFALAGAAIRRRSAATVRRRAIAM